MFSTGADEGVMLVSTRRTLGAVAVVALLASGCARGDVIERAEAISALSTTGLTLAESTCVADSLELLGELDAADPRVVRGEAERDALVAAMNRCVGSETSTEVAGTTQFEVQRGSSATEFVEEEEALPLNGDAVGEPETADMRADGVAALVALGRNATNAGCIVDHILDSENSRVMTDSSFGLGLDPIEADAFAACIGVG